MKVEIARIRPESLGDSTFLLFDWRDGDGNHLGENEYLPQRPKAYRFGEPKITVHAEEDRITLSTDRPALYVTYDHGGDDIYSDNCFTLLPCEDKVLTVTRRRTSHLGRERAPELRYLKG